MMTDIADELRRIVGDAQMEPIPKSDPSRIAHDFSDAAIRLARMQSFADAFATAVIRHGAFEIDGLSFQVIAKLPTDYISTGRHTLIFGLKGSGKTYKLTIEPEADTHQ